MHWSEKLIQIDRRIIFLIVAIVMIIPIIFPFGMPIRVSRPTQQLYDAVEESAADGNRVVMISADLDPKDQPELYPMLVSVMRHCFHRNIRVLILCLYAPSLGLAEQAIQQVTAEFKESGNDKVNGEDYVFLGWKPPPIIPLLGMGEDIRQVFPRDFYGVPIYDRPMMNNIRNYQDVDICVALSGGSPPLWYVAYAQVRFDLRVGAGFTAVSAADMYPYLHSGQFSGLLEGMKGAAEYEAMVQSAFKDENRRLATEGMSSQSLSHLSIIVFIIIGNIGYFTQRALSKRRITS